MINIFLASLIIYFVWNKSTIKLVTGIFIYSTFHFFYSVFSFGSYSELVKMHTDGSSMLIKYVGMIFMLFVFCSLFFRLRLKLFFDRRLSIYFSITILLLLIGFIGQFPFNGAQIQNVISIVAMLMLLWLVSIGLMLDFTFLRVTRRHLYILNIIIAISLLLAFCEVFFHLSWARYMYNGEVLYRASSFLFNPNLFGFWCAIITLGLSFLYHSNNDASLKRFILLGLVMISGSLYLSGSRSFICLLILTLILLLPLLRGKTLMQRVTPMAIVLVTFLAISSSSNLMAIYSEPDATNGWRSVALVGDRIFNAPLDIVKYVLAGIDKDDQEITVDKEITVAIEGRFKGEGRDSGILTLYDDAGLFGLLALIWLGLVFLVWACKVYWIKKDVASVYALVILLFFGATGISMRYQVFPVWVFIAIGLSPCLTLWRRVMLNTDKN